MAKVKPTDEPKTVTIPVSWGDVSIGDTTCRLGARMPRGHMHISTVDKTLTGRRLTADVIARRSGGPDQTSLPGFEDMDRKISGLFDVKTISVSPKRISFGLTFSIRDVDMGELAHFAKRDGRIEIHSTEVIPDGKDEEAGDGDEE